MPDWRPSATLETLKQRAVLMDRARGFFRSRGVLEVETPIVSGGAVVDRHLDPIRVDGAGRGRYLLTSPEAPMKRLLAAGSGPIVQFTRAFRSGESGALHNPEFTILEWYRTGADHRELMDEVEALVVELLGERVERPFERQSYAATFQKTIGVDALEASVDELRAAAGANGMRFDGSSEPASRDDWLDVLLSGVVQRRLGQGRPVFVDDWPASQAALAKLNPDDERVAERFELFIDGVEIANGYHELLDATEQRRRFEEANAQRVEDGNDALAMDERMLEALEAGMPSCAGVAVGFDRLVMLALGAERIDEVIAFPFDRI